MQEENKNKKKKTTIEKTNKKKKTTIEKTTLDPLTECGVINSGIGWNNNAAEIIYDSASDNPNFNDGFPSRFGLSLTQAEALPVTLQQINNCLYSATIAAKWFTTGQKPNWQQSVLDRNGGYNKGAEIRETIDDSGYAYYISTENNNKNIKPTEESHVGWAELVQLFLGSPYNAMHLKNMIVNLTKYDLEHNYSIEADAESITIYDNDKTINKRYQQELTAKGATLKNYNTVLASYLNTGVKAPMFQDINMLYKLGYLSDKNNNLNQINQIYLTNGLVMLFGISKFPNNVQQISVDLLPLNLDYATPPLISVASPGSFEGVNIWYDGIHNPDFDYSKGFTLIQNGSSNQLVFWFTIGHLANYVGDILAKIRAYNSTVYYKKLSDEKKEELDDYYIKLDKTKDLAKVIAPEWLEQEFNGKELA